MGEIGESLLVFPGGKTCPIKINHLKHLFYTNSRSVFCFDSYVDRIEITSILGLIGSWKWVSWLEVGCSEGDYWYEENTKQNYEKYFIHLSWR